jgi:precorrin-2 dehydrogenase / sirohydrochlorin ferrochelatase
VTAPAYPLLVDVRRCRVLVVGGGAVAARKVRGVVEAGGRPTVVSPALGEALEALVRREGLEWRARRYAPGDARGWHLVFAATDDPAVNALAAREAEEAGGLASVADDATGSAFHVPAAIRQGDVVVAFSTGGASPLLARRLRERLEEVVTPGLGRAARRLAALRRQVRERWPHDDARRRAFWFGLVTPEFLALAVAGSDEDVERSITRCLSQS